MRRPLGPAFFVFALLGPVQGQESSDFAKCRQFRTSSLDPSERGAIELRCLPSKQFEGLAEFYECVSQEIQELRWE
jgi:hypothetical protein